MQLKLQQPSALSTVISKRRDFTFVMAALSAAVFGSVLLAVCVGVVNITPQTAFQIILYKAANLHFGDITSQVPRAFIDIIWHIRLPRIFMAVIAGAGLAVCGTAMQATVQNPLADPYILGISAGASFGATFAILLGAASYAYGLGIAIWAFAGALASSLLVMLLSNLGGSSSTVKMILAGTIATALFSAFSSLIIYLADNAEGIRTITFWTMGSLASAKWSNLALPSAGVFLCSMFFLLQCRKLNTLLLGEEAATALGIDLSKVRRNNLIIAALMTGLITAVCGVIGFVGLVIPHIVRGFIGSDHRRLLPAAMLVGALFLIWADVLTRTALPSGELPIGIITALIGAPFFMYILFKSSLGFANKEG